MIPCFNEASRVTTVAAEVQKYLPKVIVVDDGSTDGTADQARVAGAEVVRLPKNSGKGAALQSGWRRAQELGFTWVLMLDGDGQHAAGDIPVFFAGAEKTAAELIVGNRMKDLSTMPWVRRKTNQGMSRLISSLTGVKLPDSQCGFRLAHLETLLNLPIRARHFEIESAMLVAFCQAGRKIEFVPIQTIYHQGKSKINPFTDTFRWLRWRCAQRAFFRAWSTMRVP